MDEDRGDMYYDSDDFPMPEYDAADEYEHWINHIGPEEPPDEEYYIWLWERLLYCKAVLMAMEQCILLAEGAANELFNGRAA